MPVLVREPVGRRAPVAAVCPRDFVSPTVTCFASESAAAIGASTDDATSPGAGDSVGVVFGVDVLVSSCADSLIVIAPVGACVAGAPPPLRASADVVFPATSIYGSVVRDGTELLLPVVVVPPSDVATECDFSSSPVKNPCTT